MSEVLNCGELEMDAGADNGISQRDAKQIQTHIRPSTMEFFNDSRKSVTLYFVWRMVEVSQFTERFFQ
jgi:hypothetical protein